MAALVWDETGSRKYEAGVKHGVIYPMITTGENAGTYDTGIAWNGLTSVTESPSGAESNKLWADDMPYINMIGYEDFGASIEAYSYPPEFEQCDGVATLVAGVKIGQQTRKPFGFCYTTSIGNDIDGLDHGYKIHIIYNAIAAPAEKAYETINDSPDAITFSWELSTMPTEVTDHRPIAHLEIDSTLFTTSAQQAKLEALKKKLYGDTSTSPTLPLPDEIVDLLTATGTGG